MDEAKQERLKQFLGTLPDKAVATLVRAVERERLTGRSNLPHSLILDSLRPALRQMQVPVVRVPTAQRLFCRPFEDLLIDGPRSKKQSGRILRSSINPVWRWLETDLIPAVHKEMCATITAAVVQDDQPAYEDAANTLCGAAGASIMKAIDGADPDSRKYKELVARVGDQDAVDDLHDIAKTLEIASEIRELQHHCPKPIDDIWTLDRDWLRGLYDNLSDHVPGHAPYLLLALMGRLKRSWEILSVMNRLTFSQDDLLLSTTELSILGELLIVDLEDIADEVQTVRPGLFNTNRVIQDLRYFAQLNKGMHEAMEIRKDGDWGQRVRRAKVQLAEALEALIERIPKTVYAALPVAMLSGFGPKGHKRPSLVKMPEPEVAERALEATDFLIRSRDVASDLAIAVAHSEVMSELRRFMDQYAEDLLTALKFARDHEREVVMAYFGVAYQLTRTVKGDEDAELFRRRGVVAAGSELALTGQVA